MTETQTVPALRRTVSVSTRAAAALRSTAARVVVMIVATLLTAGCASLGGLSALVQPPTFAEARDQPAEVTLQPPSASRPLGGAAVRLWAEVSNPNAFGLSLGTLDGTLYLDGTRTASAAFPMGLRLAPRERTIVPVDIAVSFSDVPALAAVVRRAAQREPVDYRLDGTIGVDAGALGQPVFGPMTLMRGELRGR